ncbi:MAG: hypothetical protein Q9165_006756 [Trypethelium subeluteriae]
MDEAAQARRPPLHANDTLDRAPRLAGQISRDGIANLDIDKANGNISLDVPVGATPDAGSSNPSAAASVVSDDEDYDTMKIDPDVLVRATKGIPERQASASVTSSVSSPGDDGEKQQNGGGGGARKTEKKSSSLQVRLEKTGRRGRYKLTADDPQIREILQRGLEREAALDSRKQRSRLRDIIFTRQFTTFDRQNPASADSPFFGFFTLFWLCLTGMLVRVAMYNWKMYGSVLGKQDLAKMMFDRDVMVLGLTDGALCGATGVGLVLQKLILKGYLDWNRSGWVIQNIWQAFYLAAAIGFTQYREWPWTHTIFIVLHSMVFLMKQHSYAFYNGYLSSLFKRRNALEEKLDQLEDMEPDSAASPPISPTFRKQNTSISTSSSVDHKTNDLHKRRRSSGHHFSSEKSEVAGVAAALESGRSLDLNQMRAFKEIIKAEIDSLNEELKGKASSEANTYPKNLTLSNFADWTCLPTLVYELEYPRQDKINWWYVAEKTAATFGCIGVMMVISQAYLYPPMTETVRMKEAGVTMQQRMEEFPWILGDMLFPLLLEQLLTWYVIWECVLNVLAELTHFADRGFYGAWWNSVSVFVTQTSSTAG